GEFTPGTCALRQYATPLVYRTSGVYAYRLLWPRTNFLTFFLLEPRGVVRAALGAAFLRAVRFTFLRSALSSIDFVFAIGFLILISCGAGRRLSRAAQAGRIFPPAFSLRTLKIVP